MFKVLLLVALLSLGSALQQGENKLIRAHVAPEKEKVTPAGGAPGGQLAQVGIDAGGDLFDEVSGDSPKKAAFHEIANERTCVPDKWLNYRNADPKFCMAIIMQRSECSHEYFNHATNGDGNCGCVTNTAKDCTHNQHIDGNVRIYAIQSLWTTYGVGLKGCAGEGEGVDPPPTHAGQILSLAGCKKSCSSVARCNSFAWNSAESKCYLKAKADRCTDKPCAWAGGWHWYWLTCQAPEARLEAPPLNLDEVMKALHADESGAYRKDDIGWISGFEKDPTGGLEKPTKVVMNITWERTDKVTSTKFELWPQMFEVTKLDITIGGPKQQFYKSSAAADHPEMVKSQKCKDKGRCFDCDVSSECWHGVDAGGSDRNEQMQISVPANSDYTSFAAIVNMRCSSSAGGHWRLKPTQLDNAHLLAWMNNEPWRAFVPHKDAHKSRCPKFPKCQTMRKKPFRVPVLGNANTRLRLELLPQDRKTQASARFWLKATNVDASVHKCLQLTDCLNLLSQQSGWAFKLRNSIVLQLQCMEGKRPEWAADLKQGCHDWLECIPVGKQKILKATMRAMAPVVPADAKAAAYAKAKAEACDETLSGTKDAGYRGCQSLTRSGRTCQKWTSQSPHAHTNTPSAKPGKGLGDHNFCRNPDGENSIWCYTTSSTRWEYCLPLKQTKAAADAKAILRVVTRTGAPTAATLVKVVKEGSTYTKNGGGSAYNAYASWVANSICVKAGQTNKHVRFGLTTDVADNSRFSNGRYVGLFPRGRLYKPPGSAGRYTTHDVICMFAQGPDIVVQKNGANLETWAGSVRNGIMHAKMFFYEDDSKLTVQAAADAAAALLELSDEVASEKECIDPGADDPEAWDCECQDKMMEECGGDADEQCFRAQMCKHQDVCQEWKDRVVCKPSLSSSLLQRSGSGGRLGVESNFSQKQSNGGLLEDGLRGKCVV